MPTATSEGRSCLFGARATARMKQKDAIGGDLIQKNSIPKSTSRGAHARLPRAIEWIEFWKHQNKSINSMTSVRDKNKVSCFLERNRNRNRNLVFTITITNRHFLEETKVSRMFQSPLLLCSLLVALTASNPMKFK